jgi:hypothetical protein
MVRSSVWNKRPLVWLLYASSAAALIVLSVLAFRTKRTDVPVPEAESRSFPRMPVEELVADDILANAKEPHSVQFQRWGPHDLTGEFVTHRKGHDDRILRIQYRCKDPQGEWVTEDNLFYLLNNEVSQVVRNAWGDDWRAAMQRLNERKPAVESPPASERN